MRTKGKAWFFALVLGLVFCFGFLSLAFAGGKSWAASRAPTGKVKVFVDIDKHTLTVFSDGKPFKTYPVCVGKPKTPTPVGEWKIIHKSYSWGGGFGSHWLGLNVPWGIFGIHGTNREGSIGQAASHGCVRMFNRDVEELFTWVKIGTPVEIKGEPSKPPGLKPRLLEKGALGPDVVELQQYLKKQGFYWGSADGRYGNLTATAVTTFQLYLGLPPTGEASPDLVQILKNGWHQQKKMLSLI